MKDESKADANAPAAKSNEPKSAKVTLLKDHEHGRERYKAGDTIEVNEADAKWLRDNKVV